MSTLLAALAAAAAMVLSASASAATTYAQSDYNKMFKGVPAACSAYSDDATNDWGDDVTDATKCRFNCTSGDACSDPDDVAGVCCTYYPSARVGGTKMSEILALSEFALVCDHHSWVDHELNWCAGYEITGYVAHNAFNAA